MENNPNVIDCLFTPATCVLHSTRVGNLVRENRRLFLHKGAWPKFKGYAYSQLHKLAIKQPQGKRAELVAEHGFDTKFGYHVVRLIGEVEQILVEGDIDLQRDNERLKAIRRGEWTEERLRQWFADKESHLERAYAESTLPAVPDEGRIKALLLELPGRALRQPGRLRGGPRPGGRRPADHPGRTRPGEGPAMSGLVTADALARLRRGGRPASRTRWSSPRSAGRTSTASPRPTRTTTCGAATSCRCGRSSASTSGRETVESRRRRTGFELDLVTHDARKFFGLLLKKNGYVLEQLYSPLVVHTTPEHGELKAIAGAASPGTTATTTSGSPRPSGGCSRRSDPGGSSRCSTPTGCC